MNIGEVLKIAHDAGYKPGVYRRGLYWRVHLDVGGNRWSDEPSLDDAAMWLMKVMDEEYVTVQKKLKEENK